MKPDERSPSLHMTEIQERAERLRQIEESQKNETARFFAEQLNQPDEPQPPQNQESHDLYDAIALAEMFEQSATDDGGYVIKEGWDLYDIIKSLITLFRAYKRKSCARTVHPPERTVPEPAQPVPVSVPASVSVPKSPPRPLQAPVRKLDSTRKLSPSAQALIVKRRIEKRLGERR